MNRFLGGILLAAVLLATSQAEITLTDLQNHQAVIEVEEATPTKISFLMQGRKGVIKMDQLTAESRAAAVEYARSKGVYRSFPPFTVQVKIAYQHRNNNEVWYKKDVKLNPTIVLTGAKKMEAMPAAEASLVLITHDTKEKYVNHVEKMEICSVETISIPEAKTGDRREFPFQTVGLTFDTARDYTNVGGNEYKYFIFGLRDPATKQIIDFQSNSPQVLAYVGKHPEARETLLAARKGAPFSEDFSQ